uniref:Uncharacterized protein n=1 Tax=Rhizophora mucronata TaxID=61149 RepID=A0A2P2QBE3_RHIMU
MHNFVKSIINACASIIVLWVTFGIKFSILVELFRSFLLFKAKNFFVWDHKC